MSQVFAFHSKPIRTLVEDEHIWFAAVDVCRILGISWRGNTLAAIPSSWQGMRKLRTPQTNQTLRVISEPAVYKLAFRSNKPEADAFTNWVASEVLPSIRKNGSFNAAPQQAALPVPTRSTDEAALDSLFAELSGQISAVFNTERRIYELTRNAIGPSLKLYGTKLHMLAVTAHQSNERLWYGMGDILESLKGSCRLMLAVGR